MKTGVKFKDFKILAPFEVKAATTPPSNPDMTGEANEIIKISGYANFSGLIEEGDIFIDLVGDVVVPSGIDVTLWKKNPQILLHHDRHTTIGRGMTVTKKQDGLFIEAEVHSCAMEEEDFYRVKSGLLSYFSVGFRTQAVEYKKVGDKQVCFITKCLLLEVSVVGIPANNESSFQIIKSLDGGDGFYAGEFKDHTSSTEDNSSKEGDSMAITRKDVLSAEKVKELEAMGLQGALDEEITGKALVDALAAVIKAELKAEMAAEAEEAAKAAEAAAAVEAEEAAKAAEAAAIAAEEAAKAAEAEEAKSVAALIAQIETMKKELETE